MSISTARNEIKIPWRIERLPSSGYLVFVSAILILTYFFEAVDNGAIGYFLPLFAQEFNLSKETLGMLGTVSNLGVMVGALLSGIVSDTIGRKKVIIVAMLIWGVSGLFQAYAWSLNALIAARILLGIGLGAQVPTTITLLSELIPSKLRARYIVALMALLPVGSAVAGLLSYFLIPSIGWRGVAMVEALPAISALLIFKYVPESAIWLETKGRHQEAHVVMTKIEQQVEKSINSPLPKVEIPAGAENSNKKAVAKIPLSKLFSKEHIKTTIMVTIWWPAALVAVYGLTTWFSMLFVERGFTITKSIGYVSVMYMGGVLGVPLVRWMLGRFGRKWTAVSIGVVAAIFAYLYGSVNALPLIIFFGLLYNVGSYATGMVNNTYTPELFPTSMRATGMGYANFIGRIGAIIGPIAIGYIITGYGVQAVFIFAGSMYLLYGIVIAILGTETKDKVFTTE